MHCVNLAFLHLICAFVTGVQILHDALHVRAQMLLKSVLGTIHSTKPCTKILYVVLIRQCKRRVGGAQLSCSRSLLDLERSDENEAEELSQRGNKAKLNPCSFFVAFA